MCEVNTHTSHKPTLSVYRREQQYDPTRTTQLRNAFASDLKKRFRRLRGLIRKAVVDQDVFGMRTGVSGYKNFMVHNVPPAQAFAFTRSQEKISGFMQWLQRQADRELLTIGTMPQAGGAIDTAWTNMYVADSYKRGVMRANYEMGKAGYSVPNIQQQGGIDAVMGTPFHMDRVGVIYSRVFEELKGITSQMDTQISRVLAQGMIDGDGPALLARKMNAVIRGGGADLGITDSLGRFIPAERRAVIMARTEVIRAHHLGMMREYRNWELEGVYIKAEHSTAGDERVCLQCSGMEGDEYTLEQAENAIPVHPQCRCIALPKAVDEVRRETREVEPEFVDAEELFEPGKPLHFETLPAGLKQKIQVTEWDSTNGALRFGAERTNHSRRIDSMFRTDGISLPADTEVYRGVRGNIFPTQAGEVFTDAGYLRFTGSKQRASIFSNYKNNDVQFITIKLPKGTKALPGQHTFEKEAVLPRGSRFRVTNVRTKNNGGYFNQDGEAIRAFIHEIDVELLP